MKVVLVVCPGGEAEVRRALPHGTLVQPELVPEGFDPRAGLLAVLGQDPRGTWTGPASLGLAAAGVVLAEDESAYLFTPVRATDGRIDEALPIGPATAQDLIEFLREELGGEPVYAVAGEPPLLVLAETQVGPPALAPASLVGRRLEDLPAGPPALLGRVVEGSHRACLELGGRATHLFPNSPGGPTRVQPLRETWLGLGPCAVLGEGWLPRALETLLGLSRFPSRDPLAELNTVPAHYDLAVVVLDRPPEGALDLNVPTVVAGDTDVLGRVPLMVAGGELGPGGDLQPLLVP